MSDADRTRSFLSFALLVLLLAIYQIRTENRIDAICEAIPECAARPAGDGER